MDHVLTLISPRSSVVPAILPTLLPDMLSALDQAGVSVGACAWLSPDYACDLPFVALSPDPVEKVIRQTLEQHAGQEPLPVDVVVQPIAGRRKQLLVADMDSTMVVGETLDDLAAHAGLKDQIAAITARAMNGEIGFEAALKERIGLLHGLPIQALDETWSQLVLMGGARTLVQTMKAHGAYAVLVSGGFKFFTSRVREVCGFDEDLANEFIFADGQLVGVEDPILGRETKLATLLDRAARLAISPQQVVAVGDGANDLDMIRAAGLGVAFHAKPVVAKDARVRIHHNDLTALLYAQGYRDQDMVG